MWLKVISLSLILGGCVQAPVVKYSCPYGVGWMTEADYAIIGNPEMISDGFADWLLKTNMYCEGQDV